MCSDRPPARGSNEAQGPRTWEGDAWDVIVGGKNTRPRALARQRSRGGSPRRPPGKGPGICVTRVTRVTRVTNRIKSLSANDLRR
jgi:hypothetical protein